MLHQRHWKLFTSAAVALAATALGAASAGPAQANGFPPDVTSAPDVARYDDAPSWSGGANCSGGFTPGAKRMQDWLRANWGSATIQGYSCRPNTANPSKTSIHGVGRASDWFRDAGNATHRAQVASFIARMSANGAAMARATGVQYWIWNRQQYSVQGTSVQRSGYSGPNPHTDHVHLEQNIAGSRLETSYWRLAGGWESLGGTLTADADVASWASGRLDVVARGPNNSVWHKTYQNGWYGWKDLGGQIIGGPTAVSWGPGRIDVFGRGTDNALHHKFWNGTAWSGWESLGGTITSDPDAASWASGRLDVFARGTNNSMFHKAYQGDQGGWYGWADLGGQFLGGPGAVSWGAGRIDLFGRGTNNALFHKYWNGQSWLP